MVQQHICEQPRTNVVPMFSLRSSDSDGAFETPEATTPVKTASPIVPRVQDPPSEIGNIVTVITVFWL